MVFITEQEILETVSMIRSENLDVRAVTMGISLTDCAGREPHEVAERVHAKIVQRAGRLVAVADEIEPLPRIAGRCVSTCTCFAAVIVTRKNAGPAPCLAPKTRASSTAAAAARLTCGVSSPASAGICCVSSSAICGPRTSDVWS